MKYQKNKMKCCIILAVIWIINTAQAAFAEGWSGYFYTGGIAEATQETSREYIQNLDEDAETETEIFPGAIFELRYKEEEPQNSWYFNNEELNIFTAGLTRLTSAGRFDAGLLYYIPEDAWEDPFDTSHKRKETQVYQYGGKASYTFEAFSAEVKLINVDVNEDLTPERYPDLGRDGIENSLFFSYAADTWNIGCQLSFLDAEGKADSSKSIGFNAGYANSFNKSWFVNVQGECNRSEFDDTHPLFGKIRQDWNLAVKTVCKRNIISSLYGVLFLECKGRKSNIDFFNQYQATFAAGIGWEF